MSSDETTQLGTKPPTTVGPGTQLNGIYEIDELIASGGMGEVYRGHNIGNKTPVAIKIILPEFAKDETVLSLFVRESDTLNHLSHDAIVRYHLFGSDPVIERPYLSMEFVDGVALGDCVKEKPFDVNEVRRLLIRICEGLAAAHAAGVIHRDLSPDNVILPGGKVKKAKIIDFGIAKSTASGHATLLGGKFAGKYNFVSPEQLGRFDGVVTERSDIYSLGLVAVSALRGKPIDMGGSHVEVIEKRSAVPDVSDIDERIRPLLEAMLQPDPADRPESMEAIVSWLQEMPPADEAPVSPSDAVTTVGEAAEQPQISSVAQNLPPYSVAPESVAPESIPPQSVAPHSVTPHSMQPQSLAPASVAPGSMPPHSIAPQSDTTGVSVAPSGVESPFGPAAADETPAPIVPPPQPVQKRGSRGGLYGLLAILLLGVGGAAAYFAMQSKDETTLP
ncbi:MAG: serine/threonine protein kinase, partial [Rhizobiaceae bacterium]